MLHTKFNIVNHNLEVVPAWLDYDTNYSGGYVIFTETNAYALQPILQHDLDKLAAKRRILDGVATLGDAHYSYIFSEHNAELVQYLRTAYPELLI